MVILAIFLYVNFDSGTKIHLEDTDEQMIEGARQARGYKLGVSEMFMHRFYTTFDSQISLQMPHRNGFFAS